MSAPPCSASTAAAVKPSHWAMMTQQVLLRQELNCHWQLSWLSDEPLHNNGLTRQRFMGAPPSSASAFCSSTDLVMKNRWSTVLGPRSIARPYCLKEENPRSLSDVNPMVCCCAVQQSFGRSFDALFLASGWVQNIRGLCSAT